MTSFYGPLVAYTHEKAFTEGQKTLGPELLRLLASRGLSEGLVLDLGCGSGPWLKQAAHAGYEVAGIDQSEALLSFARVRLPNADLRLGSIYEEVLPSQCSAVTALGEVLNYTPSPDRIPPVGELFPRVHKALKAGGVLIFDVIDPISGGMAPQRNWHEGEDFAIMFEKRVEGPVLTRNIVCFRRNGAFYERSDEIHYQHLFSEAELTSMLEHTGFQVETMTSIGAHHMLPGRRVYVAQKPT